MTSLRQTNSHSLTGNGASNSRVSSGTTRARVRLHPRSRLNILNYTILLIKKYSNDITNLTILLFLSKNKINIDYIIDIKRVLFKYNFYSAIGGYKAQTLGASLLLSRPARIRDWIHARSPLESTSSSIEREESFTELAKKGKRLLHC